MQLLLIPDDRSQTLIEIHRRLHRRFGAQRSFLLLDPVSQLIMGLIGGRTYGEITKSAFKALLSHFRSWEAVRDAPVAEIHEIIGAVNSAEVKAPRLKESLNRITRAHGRLTLDSLESMTVVEALAWLEQLPGVGRKVAAATLNFSTLRKAALVIDTHHLRILLRVKLIGERSTLRQAYDRMMPLLPPDWSAADLDEHHQLMKALGQTTCRSGTPICHRCPLKDLCPEALRNLVAGDQISQQHSTAT